MKSGRRFLTVVLALALIAAGCSDDDDTATPTAGSTTTSAAPTRGGTLVVAIDSDPGGLNPATTTSGATHTAAELMYNGLVELDDKSEPKGELAESWDVEGEGLVYTFKLRPDVKWHDGKPFTSADVKYSFDEVLLKLHSRTRASVGAALEAIEAPDETTVVFRFKKPYAPLLQQLDVTEAPIIAKHVYEGTDPMTNPANQAPVGTGPFKIASYTKGSEVRMDRNPDYFKKGLPYLDAVVMRVIAKPETQVSSLENDEVGWLFDVPGPDIERLKATGRFDTLETAINPGGTNCILTVSYNLDRPMFKDVRTRKGIAQALNREQFFERVLFREGKVAAAPISSGIPFAHADDLTGMPKFDRAAAQRLLDQAGWKGEGTATRTSQGVEGVPEGTKLAFEFLSFPTFVQYGELFKAQLAEVGAEVTVRAVEPPVFVDTVFTKRAFDTSIISYCNGTDPEIGVRRMYVSSSIGPVPFSNASAYRNPEVDALFDQAQGTLDREERTTIYRKIQEAAVKDLPYFWIVETTSTRMFSDKCKGFGPSGHFAETAYCTT